MYLGRYVKVHILCARKMQVQEKMDKLYYTQLFHEFKKNSNKHN